MEEKVIEEVKDVTVESDEKVVDKGKEFVDSLKEIGESHKWNGVRLYKILKGLIIFCIIVISFIELYAIVWPKVKHNFPERIPVEEKCKKADCDKSCNGECVCKYVNIYEKEEEITCVVEG